MFLLAACTPLTSGISSTPKPTFSEAQTQTPTARAPNPEDEYNIPYGVNPLTGQPVTDPKLLKTPAMLVSISNFPAYGRPQAGLSFAPYVFEFYITEVATRFLAVFYGGFPSPEIPVTGNCAVRKEPFPQTDLILGNRIWLDSNGNGLLDSD